MARVFQSKWDGPRPASIGVGANLSVTGAAPPLGTNFALHALSKSPTDGNPVLSIVDVIALAFSASLGLVYFTANDALTPLTIVSAYLSTNLLISRVTSGFFWTFGGNKFANPGGRPIVLITCGNG